ncbi:MAG: tetratricopeptide repeat protein [Pseudomonadota bacterium]
MSIIFKKLKSLKGGSRESSLESASLLQGQHIYTFRKLVFSPKGVLFILAAIIGFGSISFYSLSFLKTMLESGSKNAIVVQHHRPEPMPGDDMMNPAGDPSGQPPGIDSTLPESEKNKPDASKEEEFKVPQFFVLKANLEPEQSSDASDDLLPQAQTVRAVIPARDKARAKTRPKSIYEFNPLASSDPFGPANPIIQPHSGTGTPEFMAKLPQPTRPSNKPDQTKLPKTDPVSIKEQALKKEQIEKKQTQARIEVARMAQEKKTQKISAIAGLAADLENAIETQDNARADQLFEQLEHSTDKTSFYYLKLKAFQLIRENQYDQAKIYLNKVLEKDNTDLEAGLNMAIIEIREGAFKDAKKRLIWLNDRYPSHNAIDRLLNQL